MLTVACVNWRNFAGRGEEYVANLFAAVDRHLSVPWRGACLTDDPSSVPPGIEPKTLPGDTYGWWNKLALFRPDTFLKGSRVLYFDLDTVIVGSLDDIASYDGRFAAMDNPEMEGLASGVMAWEAGKLDRIWDRWEYNWRPALPMGDQQWIGFVEKFEDRFQRLYPGQLVSYKLQVGPEGVKPDNVRVVYFHGRPRPHQVSEPWLKEAWSGESSVSRTGTSPNIGAAAVAP